MTTPNLPARVCSRPPAIRAAAVASAPTLALDHAVIVVKNLDRAVDDYTKLGFDVVRGGVHPTGGTHNALIPMGDGTYIELIGFFRPNPSHRWWSTYVNGGGLIDFCTGTDDIQKTTDAFRAAGVGMSDPQPNQRVRPDGVVLRWTASSPTKSAIFQVPFLLQDITPRDERVPPAPPSHPNGVVGIRKLTIAVKDVKPIRRWYSKIVGEPGAKVDRPDLDARGVRFSVGGHEVELLAPKRSHGPLAEWLRSHPPSPYSITLKTIGNVHGPLDTGSGGARVILD